MSADSAFDYVSAKIMHRARSIVWDDLDDIDRRYYIEAALGAINKGPDSWPVSKADLRKYMVKIIQQNTKEV